MAGRIIVYQIIVLVLLAFTGYAGVRLKLVNQTVREGLAQLVFNITLPLLIFTKLTRLELSFQLARESLWFLLFVYVAFGLMYGVAFVSRRALNLKQESKGVFLAHSMFGNIVFLGFPLLDALFPGGDGIYFATLYHLASSTLLWSVGVLLLNRNSGTSGKAHLRKLLNPNTLAFALGLVFAAFSLKLPPILLDSFGKLGDTTIFLSMIYIGILISSMKPEIAFRKKTTWMLAWNKLILVPTLMVLLLVLINRIAPLMTGRSASTVLILETAMPCMANIVILAKIFGNEDNSAMENVFLTTVLSILTLPLMLWLMNVLLY